MKAAEAALLYSQALAWYWPRFLTWKRSRVGAVFRFAAAGRFRGSRRVHIVSLGIQAGRRLWLGRCARPSFLKRRLARSPITVIGVRHSMLRRGNAARYQERAENQNVFAHVDILFSINVSAVEAFRDANGNRTALLLDTSVASTIARRTNGQRKRVSHRLGVWIPGSPLTARPGMTAERLERDALQGSADIETGARRRRRLISTSPLPAP